MTLSYSCPECSGTSYNVGAEPEDIEIGNSVDFGCEDCGCDFTITFTMPNRNTNINITKHGFKVGNE